MTNEEKLENMISFVEQNSIELNNIKEEIAELKNDFKKVLQLLQSKEVINNWISETLRHFILFQLFDMFINHQRVILYRKNKCEYFGNTWNYEKYYNGRVRESKIESNPNE